MILTQTSVSQVESASHDQQGGCARKWWFSAVNGLKPDQSESAAEGVAGHAHLAHYFRTGELPQKRSKMSKTATAALLKHTMLPRFGVEDLMVELRFDGQEQLYPDRRCDCGHGPDAHPKPGACCASSSPTGLPRCTCAAYRPAWVPLDVSQTLKLGGLPWDGFIDLTWRNGPLPVIIDHKFFTPARPDLYPDPYTFLKKPSDLIKTVQLPVYVMAMRRYWPDAAAFTIGHHCVSKKGVDSLIRTADVTVDQVLERVSTIEKTVGLMRAHAQATNQDDVPHRAGPACEAWNGCPHQSICSAYLNRNTNKGTTVALSETEMAIFDSIPMDVAPASTELTPEQIQTAAANDAAVAADKARMAKIAEAKAAAKKAAEELAALEAPPPAAPPAPPVRRMVMHDVPPEAPVLPPDAPASKPELASEKPPAPPPPPAPKASRKKAEAPPPAAPPPAPAPAQPPAVTLPPPVFAGERQSDRDATAAMDAIQAKPTAPVSGYPAVAVKTTEALTEMVFSPKASRDALASLLENLAVLVRAIA